MPIQEWSDRIWLVQLADEPALSEELLQAKDKAERVSPMPDMVIDLNGVTQVNSSNLSQLLRLRKLAVDHDIRLVLAGPSDSVWAVFMTTGLDKVFDFAADVTVALAGLQMKQ